MPKLKIAPPPQATPPVDREKLAADVGAARAAADKLVSVVVATGAAREQGLAVARHLNEYADALTFALEGGAADHEIAPHLGRFGQLYADAVIIAADPAAYVAAQDVLATGRTKAPPLGEVEATAP